MFIRSNVRSVAAAGLVAVLPFALPAYAVEPVMVREVDAVIALDALTNPEAATRFANIELDLENAIAARLVDRIDTEDGVKINIDISELELSNSFTETFNLADTKLVGVVQVIGTAQNPDSASYELSVDVNGSKSFFPEGTVLETLPADSAVYYDSLIAAFADAVVIKLDE